MTYSIHEKELKEFKKTNIALFRDLCKTRTFSVKCPLVGPLRKKLASFAISHFWMPPVKSGLVYTEEKKDPLSAITAPRIKEHSYIMVPAP